MRLRRRYRPKASSLIFVGVTAFLGAGAVQQEPNLLPLVFGFAITAVVLSGVVGGGMLMGVRPRRSVVGPAQVGSALRIRYELRSASRFLPAFALRIRETSSPKKAADTDHWERHFEGDTDSGRAFVAQLGPGESVYATARCVPTRRGVAHLLGVEVGSAFPFGVFHKAVIADQPARVLVRPRVSALRSGAMPELLSRAGRESQTSRRRRTGDEFFSLREYTPGDPPRFVAWRSSARMGSLVVREHAERSSRRVRLVLVCSPGATEEDQERAIELFASIASGLARTDVALHIEIPQGGTRYDASSEASVDQALDALAALDANAAVPESLRDSSDAVVYVRTDEAAGLPAPPAGARVHTSRDLERLTHRGDA